MPTETFDFPTSQELQAIEQVLMPRLEKDRIGLQIMPVVNTDAAIIQWEQLDNFLGLQQVRGLNGSPGKVNKTGAKRYRMDPGAYGEFETIDELELTERRKLGDLALPIDISDLVGMAQKKLLQRRLDRIEWIIWTLLTSGTFSTSGPGGNLLHTDSFTLGTNTASPLFSDLANSYPMQFFRTVQLNQRGQSVTFGSQAKIYANKATCNHLLNNTNALDLGGRFRLNYGQTLNSLEDVNRILSGYDLPQINEYDQGYLDDSGTFVPFIPAGKMVLVGARPAGQVVGEFRMTRNANNPDLGPGAYTKVIDRGDLMVPRSIEVHDGFNGGPIIYYPGAIRVLTVA